MAVGLFFLQILSHFALGAFQNHSTTLLGAKAAGLGGAATAVINDPSSAAYYNPALILFTDQNNITSSVSIYNKYNSDYGKTTSLIDAGKSINQGFFRSVASATGTILKSDHYALAASVLVPDYDFFSGEVLSNATNNTFLSYVDESLWAGGSASLRLSENSSVGVSAYYTARSLVRSSINQVTLSPTQVITNIEEKNSTHNGLIFNFGYFQKTNDSFSWGLNLRTPLISIIGNTNYFQSQVDTLNLPASLQRLENLKTKYQVPLKLSAGFAWHPSEKWMISLDVHHFLPLEYYDVENTLAQDFMNYTGVTNFAMGVQYDLDEPNITLRTGVFSNFSSVKQFNDGTQSTRQPDRIDMLGFAGNLSFKTHDSVEYTLGGYFNAGTGKAIEKLDNALQIIGKDQKIFTLLISVTIGL